MGRVREPSDELTCRPPLTADTYREVHASEYNATVHSRHPADQPHMGGQGPVKPSEMGAAEVLHGLENPRCLHEEIVDINRLALRRERDARALTHGAACRWLP